MNFGLVKTMVHDRRLILRLAADDFRLRFAGSKFGVMWGFIQPLITIVLYWFVFEVGFRSGNVSEGVPYVLWLVAGIVPWFFFSEAWNGAVNCLYEYSFLVKKVQFHIEDLPVVKIVSSLFVHVFFIGVIFILFACYGYSVTIYNLELFYYIACEIVLIYALALITSSIAVFIKDTIQVVNILMQIFFWTIPIVWNEEAVSAQVRLMLKCNPVYYLVEGFRNLFVYKVWFWEQPLHTLYFWTVTLALLFLGIWMYKKLNRYFADLL